MADTIFTRALAQAAQASGSNQALADALRAPERTLLRWMSGRAQMPLRAFHRLIELLVALEQSPQVKPAAQTSPGAKLSFNVGDLVACCARCASTQFAPQSPAEPLRMTSVLLCCSCNLSVGHGALLAELAADAVRLSRNALKGGKPAAASAKIIRLAAR